MKHIACIPFLAMLPNIAFSQQHISYAYDASGNRTQKQTISQRQSVEPQGNRSRSADIENNADEQFAVCRMLESNRLEIKTEVASNAMGSYDIFLTDGKIICHGILEGTHTAIDMSGYAPGVYVVTATSGGKKQTWKVTKK